MEVQTRVAVDTAELFHQIDGAFWKLLADAAILHMVEKHSWEELDLDHNNFQRAFDRAQGALQKLRDTHHSLHNPGLFDETSSALEELNGVFNKFLDEGEPKGISGFVVLAARIGLVKRIVEDLQQAAFEQITNNTFTINGIEEIAPLTLVEKAPQAVVQYAFTHFEDVLRKRLNAPPDRLGSELINDAFGQKGVLNYGETVAERERARDFLAGAYGLFRNPRNHRLLEDDTGMALSLLVVSNLMLQIIEDAQDR